MSILIKGMMMPKHCMDCPFMASRDNDDCILQSAEANENFENWEQMKARCPLVEVPSPHGRLIDAAELQQDIHMHHYILTDVWHSRDNGMFTNGIDYAISVAPTIIEAERRERRWPSGST